MSKIILILGDQLSHSLSSLQTYEAGDTIVMAELGSELQYARHHSKKIILIFSAMRHFAEELKDNGKDVDYLEYGKLSGIENFTDLVKEKTHQYKTIEVVVTEPSEFRVKEEICSWQSELNVTMLNDDRFFACHEEFSSWAKDKKQLRMEFFYRQLRKKHNLLMDGDKPAGGKWNYDQENRKKYNRDSLPEPPMKFECDSTTSEVIQLVKSLSANPFGSTDDFWFAVNEEQAQLSLEYFIEKHLSDFGAYQDAMLLEHETIHHSVLSMYINIGLLTPENVCQRVERAYRDGAVPLNSAEGFIRQVLGWREYIRGIYWYFMPEYKTFNTLHADNPLPEFYWNAETKMQCMAHAVQGSLENSYAHHIQRLMVTGNFALLVGIDVESVHEWYLGIYADAFEWVELPNTLGMALHADGGIVGSKPYCASGKYINRMSNYCKSCHYNVNTNDQEDSCPFNSLYWHFLNRHEEKFKSNPRMTLVYKGLEKLSDEKKHSVISRAEFLLANLNEL